MTQLSLELKCTHWWVLDNPHYDEKITGVCKLCGEVRKSDSLDKQLKGIDAVIGMGGVDREDRIMGTDYIARSQKKGRERSAALRR